MSVNRSQIWNIANSDEFVDKTTSKFEYRQYYDKNSISHATNPNLKDFSIQINEPDSYILPSAGYLNFAVQVAKTGTNTPFDAADIVAVCNNFAASFFHRGEYVINDQVVETQSFLHIKSLLEAIIEYSPDHESHSSDQGWALDTSSGTERVYAITPITAAEIAGTDAINPPLVISSTYNKGFDTRYKLINGAGALKPVYFRIPLARLFNIHKHISTVYRGTRHEIRLQRQPSDNQLLYHTGAAGLANGDIQLLSLSLMLPIAIPSIQMMASLESSLKTDSAHNIAYPLNQVYRSAPFTAANTNPRYAVTTLQEKPTRVWIALQTITRVNTTSQEVNRTIFDNLDLTKTRVLLGSKYFPEYELTTKFATKDYVRAYHDFLQVSNPDMDFSSGSLVNYDTYGTLFPIFAVDLSAQDETLFAANQVSDLTVELSLGTAGGAEYVIWVMIESERKLLYNVVDRRILVSRA